MQKVLAANNMQVNRMKTVGVASTAAATLPVLAQTVPKENHTSGDAQPPQENKNTHRHSTALYGSSWYGGNHLRRL
eukprot:1735190-Amphidinium_carterae.1